MTFSLSERQQMDAVEDFYNKKIKSNSLPPEKEIEKIVTDYLESVKLDDNLKNQLKLTLLIQYYAHFFTKRQKNVITPKEHNKVIKLANYISEHPVKASSAASASLFIAAGVVVWDSSSMGAASVAAGVTIGASLLAAAVAVPALVALGHIGRDIYQVSKELSHGQRKMANWSTLLLTAGAIAGTIVAGMAIFAACPHVSVLIALAIGLALLVKAVRLFVNHIDAKINRESSGVAKDSRFRLTKDEEAKLRREGKDVEMIKEMIRTLAFQARITPTSGKDKTYEEIISKLTKLKKGIVDEVIDTKLSSKYQELKEKFKPRNADDNSPKETHKPV